MTEKENEKFLKRDNYILVKYGGYVGECDYTIDGITEGNKDEFNIDNIYMFNDMTLIDVIKEIKDNIDKYDLFTDDFEIKYEWNEGEDEYYSDEDNGDSIKNRIKKWSYEYFYNKILNRGPFGRQSEGQDNSIYIERIELIPLKGVIKK